MFHFNQTFATFTDNFDNFKPGCYDLPTTTDNSPGSLKYQSMKQYNDSPLQCSFQNGSQSSHASAIWDASIRYIETALSTSIDHSKGLNNETLFGQWNFQTYETKENTLDDLIMRNPLFKMTERHELMNELKGQVEITDLMKELTTHFNENIFHQLSYVVYKIVQKRNFNKKHQTSILNDEDQPIIPQFDCFWGYEEEQLPKATSAPFSIDTDMDDVMKLADKCSKQLVEEIFFDNNLKRLNLKEAKKSLTLDQNLNLFAQFFQTISRAVYLSASGFYNHPNENAMCEQYSQHDFSFDMGEIGDFNIQEFQLPKEESSNKFIRAYPEEWYEDEEQDFDFVSVPSKKRKLQ